VDIFYKIGDVAKELGVSSPCLSKWRRMGIIPLGSHRSGGLRDYYSQEDIERIREIVLARQNARQRSYKGDK
jgi:DNA-binding transcriptional MerR regulator